MIIKTTHALNVPPTAAGVAFDTSTNGSSLISKNDTKRNIYLNGYLEVLNHVKYNIYKTDRGSSIATMELYILFKKVFIRYKQMLI